MTKHDDKYLFTCRIYIHIHAGSTRFVFIGQKEFFLSLEERILVIKHGDTSLLICRIH